MAPPTKLQRLGSALQAFLEDHGTSARSVSTALGWHSAFLTRCFNGHRPLRVETVFEVLKHLNVVPYEFFEALYPFGGPKRVTHRLSASEAEDDEHLLEAVRKVFRRRGLLPPVEYRLRMGEWLKRDIRRSGHSVRGVSMRLGLAPNTLGQALRGTSQLTFAQVFGALDLISADPGRLFLAVFLSDLDTPLERLQREELLRHLEHTVSKTERGLAAARKRKKKPAPKKDPPPQTEPGSETEREPKK